MSVCRYDGSMRQKVAITRLLDSEPFCKLLIVACALTWGFSFFIMKDAVAEFPVFWLLSVRFCTSAIVLALLFHRQVMANLNRETIGLGLALGILGWAAYSFQTVGITMTTPGKNAFLTGCYCVIVPFCVWAMGMGRPERYNVIGAFLSLVGLGFVALDNGLPLNMGDVLTLCGAVFYALQTALIAKRGRSDAIDVRALSMWEFLAMGLSCLACTLALERPPAPKTLTPANVLVLAFLALVCSFGCLLVINHAFTKVDPTAGSLLSSLESPSGVFFSVLLGGEMLTPHLVLGFAIIFLAIVFSEAGPLIVGRILGERPARKRRLEERP